MVAMCAFTRTLRTADMPLRASGARSSSRSASMNCASDMMELNTVVRLFIGPPLKGQQTNPRRKLAERFLSPLSFGVVTRGSPIGRRSEDRHLQLEMADLRSRCDLYHKALVKCCNPISFKVLSSWDKCFNISGMRRGVSRIQLSASELRMGYRYFVSVTGFRPDRQGTEQYRSRITEAWRFRSTTIVRTGGGRLRPGHWNVPEPSGRRGHAGLQSMLRQ